MRLPSFFDFIVAVIGLRSLMITAAGRYPGLRIGAMNRYVTPIHDLEAVQDFHPSPDTNTLFYYGKSPSLVIFLFPDVPTYAQAHAYLLLPEKQHSQGI